MTSGHCYIIALTNKKKEHEHKTQSLAPMRLTKTVSSALIGAS
jgi:hypothetical protein